MFQNPGWSAAVDHFAASLAAEEKSPLTIRNYRRELRAFAGWHRDAYDAEPDLTELAPAELLAYKEHLLGRKLKPATVNLALAALKSILKWARDAGLLAGPVRTPKTVRRARRMPRWLTRKEERKLLRVVARAGKPRDAAIVAILLHMGLRISELAVLEWGDVKVTPRKGEIRVHGKGSKERTLPISDNQPVRDAFRDLGWDRWGRDRGRRVLQGQRGPLSASGIKQLLTPYGRAAELDAFSAHMLRHTCARRMVEQKQPIQLIAEWLGHESINTTLLYTLPSREDMEKAIDRRGGGDLAEDDED